MNDRQQCRVPYKMRNATKEAVTPGAKRIISLIVPPRLKSGFPAATIFAVFFACIKVNMIIVTSKTLLEISKACLCGGE